MKSAEEIIKEIIPNGVINLGKGLGDGKPQYRAEVEAISKCMKLYAEQAIDECASKVDVCSVAETLAMKQSVLNVKTLLK